MATVITSVERVEGATAALQGWSMELPTPGQSLDGYFMRIAGWVVGNGRPVRSISVFHGGFLVTSGEVGIVRSNVSTLFALDPQARTGFWCTLNVATLPEEFELRVCANLEGAPPVEFAVLRGVHPRLRVPFEPKLQPLSVTSLGRTGTTLVMRMLGRHPEVVVHDVHPYETRMGAYWMHALGVLSGGANHFRSSHPDKFLHDPFFIGSNPWASDRPVYGDGLRSWMRGGLVEEIAAFCQKQMEAAYLQIAADQGQSTARFFAEKNVPTHVPRLMRQMYAGMREIVLVRDFRDMICSMLAFDSKRNNANFQKKDVEPEKFALRIMFDFGRLVDYWLERRDSTLLLRYEDLVAEPAVWLRRVTEYAGIDSSDAVVEGMIAAATAETADSQKHRTTESWAGSTGRYLRDMSPDMRTFCAEKGRDVLEKLGYAL